MILGNYTLNLSCDAGGSDCASSYLTGQSYAECSRWARDQGWDLGYTRRKAICPKCAKQIAALVPSADPC